MKNIIDLNLIDPYKIYCQYGIMCDEYIKHLVVNKFLQEELSFCIHTEIPLVRNNNPVKVILYKSEEYNKSLGEVIYNYSVVMEENKVELGFLSLRDEL